MVGSIRLLIAISLPNLLRALRSLGWKTTVYILMLGLHACQQADYSCLLNPFMSIPLFPHTHLQIYMIHLSSSRSYLSSASASRKWCASVSFPPSHLPQPAPTTYNPSSPSKSFAFTTLHRFTVTPPDSNITTLSKMWPILTPPTLTRYYLGSEECRMETWMSALHGSTRINI